MLLLVSGEGPSDIGSVGHGEDGTFFQHGPIYLFLDKLFEAHYQYSFLSVEAVAFVHKSELVGEERKHHGRQFSAPGKRKAKETGYYYENARRLALKASQMQVDLGRVVIPVLFEMRTARSLQGEESGPRNGCPC